MSPSRLRPGRIALMLAALWLGQILYTVLPVDLIPDLMPLVGWLDDLILLAISVGLTGGAVHLVHRHSSNPLLDDLEDGGR